MCVLKKPIEVAAVVVFANKDMRILNFQLFVCLFVLLGFYFSQALPKYYKFVVKEVSYTRLCSTKKILTVNGQFPGPTLYARSGDTLTVDVINRGNYNITLHWHGVRMQRSSWYDGPAYITQCPIQPGKRFRQKIIFSEEEGTLWWHAHSEYAKATVHGPIIVYPKYGKTYPFPKPYGEVPIVLGEWWKKDIQEVYETFTRTGGDQDVSDALTINGQPGDHYSCSKAGTFRMTVITNKTYLLRVINAGMSEPMFFAIANHSLKVVGADGSYIKPFNSNYITIFPGQTIDVLLKANKKPHHSYYMAAKVYNNSPIIPINNSTTTAILNYAENSNLVLSFPTSLPDHRDVNAATSFSFRLRSLADKSHPVNVPTKIDHRSLYVISINFLPCMNNNNMSSCDGPSGTRFASSINNLSFVNPKMDILDSYYDHQNLFDTEFPVFPLEPYNYTASNLPSNVLASKRGTQVRVLEYNSTVEIVLQGTNVGAPMEHPIHLHGSSFYVVGWGFGNFNSEMDPKRYNLVDPPFMNTVAVPSSGWTTIRFRADNPGVWLMHCHIDRHMVWGMDTVFIVKNGKASHTKIVRRPSDMPPC